MLSALGHFDGDFGLAVNLAGQGIDGVELQAVMAHAGANLPGDQRILLRHVVRDDENGGSVIDVRHGGERILGARAQRGGQADVIGGAMVIEIVGAERDAGEAVQQVIFFVCGVVRADHADGAAAVRGVHLLDAACDFLECVLPARGLELSVAAHEWLADAFRIRGEIVAEATLGAQEFAVEAGMVPIIGAQDFVVAHAERGLAAVRAMGARLRDVGHLPGARLITIRAAGERADRADVDAHTAFFACQLVGLVRQDYGEHAAGADAERFHVHAFVADAHAAEAENAARRIVIDQRRPFLLGRVELFLDEAGFVQAVAEGHILQLALATFVADRAIERVIREQELDHVLAGFVDLVG